MARVVPTVCRVCESACGLLATVDDGRVRALAADPEHPVSRGHACTKGLGFLHAHHHPRRLLRPRVDGVEVGWAAALAHAGAGLRRVHAAHGPDAVGLYVGNAASQSLGAVLGVAGLQRALGTRALYTALSLDNVVMFPVLEACVGNAMASFVADYAGSDRVVLFGTDPLQSQPSQAQAHPRGVHDLVDVARRGQLVVVDPRPSTTARRASLHLRPRPGGDLALLASLAREALARVGPDPLLDPADLAALAPALAPWTRARAAAWADLRPEEVDALHHAVADARRPLVWSGLGVLLGGEGTLGYWLTLVLQALLGGVDVPGGWVAQPGAVDLPRLWARVGGPGADPANPSAVGGFPAVLGTWPAATLADHVLAPGDAPPLKALVVVGGNPAVSLPDGDRARRALRALDLLVVLDILPSDTTTLAHVVLPAADWLERPESGLLTAHLRPVPHLQRAPAVVRPPGEARPDWDILGDLARAAGRPRFGSWAAELALRATGADAETVARWVVGASGTVSWAAMEGRGATGRAEGLRVRGGRLRLAIPRWTARLDTVTAPEDGPRLLTSVRPVETMNSWLHDTPGGRRAEPRIGLSPEDAARLGVGDGEPVRVRGVGTVEGPVRVTPGLRPGVVVVPYGWGHLPGALAEGRGVAANVLVGTAELEPETGAPRSNGARVVVERVDADHPAPGSG